MDGERLFIYVLATVNEDKEISFNNWHVCGCDENQAYWNGYEIAFQDGYLPPPKGSFSNDYIIDPEVV